ncbi:MAG: hypothetical protein N2Z79_00495, partial [Candidatus Omnitrophica bacterium]|nr:hypothetical protein [Candidatus Omnitrophota bacterium]
FLPYKETSRLNLFYKVGKVLEVKYSAEGIKIKVNLPENFLNKLLNNNEINKSIRISKNFC